MAFLVKQVERMNAPAREDAPPGKGDDARMAACMIVTNTAAELRRGRAAYSEGRV